jgi:hypothetical protein
VRICTRTGGLRFERASCSLCRSLAAKARSADRAEAARRGQHAPLAHRPYGTQRLSWTPPERLLAAPAVEDPAPTDFRQLLERFRARSGEKLEPVST